MVLTADNAFKQKDCQTALKQLRDALLVEPTNALIPGKIQEIEALVGNVRCCNK